jgi:hypothetical protein
LVKRFRERVSGYLKSLCSGSSIAEVESREDTDPIERKPVPRRRRLNFILHGGLVKVSRKNIVLEEF